MESRTQLHASCVSVEGRGILLLGESGSGKSDLALRLIDGGGVLVADDRVNIERKDALIASAPEPLQGLLEVRGIGIMRLPYEAAATLALAIRLVSHGQVERLPEPRFFDCLGVRLPLLWMDASEASACAKIRVSLRR